MNNLGCLRSGGGYENNDLFRVVRSQDCQRFTVNRHFGPEQALWTDQAATMETWLARESSSKSSLPAET
jgi:hypothetical protein